MSKNYTHLTIQFLFTIALSLACTSSAIAQKDHPTTQAKKDSKVATENKVEGKSTFDTNLNIIGPLKRSVAKRVFPKNINKSGKITFNVCIDRNGDVVYAKHQLVESTLTDEATIADALSAMEKTKFEKNNDAYSKECGQWTMTFSGMKNKVQSNLAN